MRHNSWQQVGLKAGVITLALTVLLVWLAPLTAVAKTNAQPTSPQGGAFSLVDQALAAPAAMPSIPKPASLIGPTPGSIDAAGNPVEGQDPISYFKSYLGALTRMIIGLLGFLAVFFIVYGGFIYVTSGGDPKKADVGKSILTYAVIGLLLASFAYAIVSTVIGVPNAINDTPEMQKLKKASPSPK